MRLSVSEIHQVVVGSVSDHRPSELLSDEIQRGVVERFLHRETSAARVGTGRGQREIHRSRHVSFGENAKAGALSAGYALPGCGPLKASGTTCFDTRGGCV